MNKNLRNMQKIAKQMIEEGECTLGELEKAIILIREGRLSLRADGHYEVLGERNAIWVVVHGMETHQLACGEHMCSCPQNLGMGQGGRAARMERGPCKHAVASELVERAGAGAVVSEQMVPAIKVLA